MVHQIWAIIGLESIDEEGTISPHRGLWTERLLQLPHDDRLRMIKNLAADAGKVVLYFDVQLAQVIGWSDAREQQQSWRIDRAGTKHDLLARTVRDRPVWALTAHAARVAVLEPDVECARIADDMKILPRVHDRMQVGNAG